MRKNIFLFSLCVFLIFSFTAEKCQTEDDYTLTIYKTLVTSAVVYDVTMKSVADLYEKGIVDEAFKADAIAYGEKFWSAFHKLELQLERYAEKKDNGEKLDTALGEFDIAYSNFQLKTAEAR